MVTLILGSKPTSVLCHMGDFGCGDGGWTPVMKIDGNKVLYFYFLFFICYFIYLGLTCTSNFKGTPSSGSTIIKDDYSR